jgi:PAS domain S-box-containing protein
MPAKPDGSNADREDEERFKLLVESVRDYGIFMLDPEGRVASWNIGAERIKGWRADEIIGRHFSVFYPHEAADAGWPAHELAVARRDGRFEDAGWRVRKDGSRFWANVVITAVHDREGVLRGFAKVTRDMTESKRVEELEAGERTIHEFLAMLGHELRNPLAPICNAVAILRSGRPDEASEGHAVSVIERQVEYLTRLVDDLLDVSRITSGKISLRKEPIDLLAAVLPAIEACRTMFERNQQVFELRHEGQPLPINADQTRITQVVLNLLGNASKYTPPGGRIVLILEQAENRAVIRVADNGIGIPAGLLPRMFDLFVQGERALDRPEGGLGLGLTLVRRLVQLHGGTVSASSQGAGRGSEFEVRLPLSADAAPHVPGDRPARAPAAAGATHRVLVVDDNADSAETMAVLVGIWGHTVRTAHDAAGALQAAAELAPDVVLLDIGLPGVSGYEVAVQMRALPGLESVVLIAITGYGQEEDRRRTREAGFSHHLTKPVRPDSLKAILSSLT